ncbi:MAG: DNA internalization-related competence protein ComEC/Rec2 [Ardenticatenaceae bacterium]|nr:DNA internalization-related competence protein ComEC/Rec2 [Ardenticatenaceae bacterium]MCB8990375.1 DNA internalization-related competence protein ComEC/Rec2 [Ardenticatenaceae bacterium]
MTVVFLGIAWLAGIWLASFVAWPLISWLVMAGIGLAGGVLLRQQRRAQMALITLIGLGVGGAWYGTAVPTLTADHITTYNDSPNLTFTGLVSGEPDVRDRSINLRVTADSLILPTGKTLPITGDVLVRAPRFPLIEYGSVVEVNGRLETPPEFDDFSYKEYLARQGIYSLINQPQITVRETGQGSPIYRAIYAFKARAQASINRLIPDPAAALLSGILLGNDNGLSPELADDFRATGMTHIIAISGFNIAILIGILVGLSQPLLKRRGAVAFAIVGVAAYTLLVGADPSVVRAAIMGSIYLIASRWLGRPNYIYASLFLAAFVMTLLNPLALWDVGFQLSFAATLSLMLYATPLTQWMQQQLARRFNRQAVRAIMSVISESVLITLAAQVLTLPLMAAYFGQLSLISLPANALILPAQPGVMVWGGLAALVGMVIPAIGQLFGWVAWLFLAYTIWLVRLFAAVPGAAVPVTVSPGVIVAVYALIGLITLFARLEPEKRAGVTAVLRKNLSRRLAVGVAGVTAVLTLSWGMTQPDGNLHVVFLDVGQGDATLIQTPSGRQILVDGGYYPSVLNDGLGQHIPFWQREIDLMVATHPDADHISGLAGVFERYHVGQLITNGQGLGESPIYDAVLLAAEEAGTPIRRALVGERIVIEDGVQLEVLHPGAVLLPDERNENSVAMRLTYGDFSLVFTGDAEQQAEQAMLKSGLPLDALVYKAGHHGSNGSSSAAFLRAIRPSIITISVGADNNFGHPSPEMLQRAADVGAAVLRTDELGTIEVVTDGHTMWWQAEPHESD